MKRKRQQKLLCFLYEQAALDRWICRLKKSCDEVNAAFDCGNNKKKKRRR